MKLSAIVPCYNDEEVLHALAGRLHSVFRAQDWDYEILLVDDGSSDGTWRIIRELSVADNHVIGIRLSRNHGHQLALAAGIAQAAGDRILMIDSDLQDPPELVPEMMKLMDAGADVVYGQRRSRRGVPPWKKFAYKMFYKLLSLLAGSDIPPDTGDFRLISRTIAELLKTMPEHYRFIRGMVSWLGYKQVPLLYRSRGQTRRRITLHTPQIVSLRLRWDHKFLDPTTPRCFTLGPFHRFTGNMRAYLHHRRMVDAPSRSGLDQLGGNHSFFRIDAAVCPWDNRRILGTPLH